MQKKIIDQGLDRLGIDISYPYDKFEAFEQMLLSYNERMDLTNITEPDEVALKHFLDSMTIFKVGQLKEEAKVIDLGTGAGFPAIPIKLVNDKLDMTLLDSQKKRLNFLDDVIDQMDLANIRTIHSRAEDMARDKDHREGYDILVSRAVARLRVLVELGLPLVRPGGIMVAMKGKDARLELDEAGSAITKLGGIFREIKEFDLSEDGDDKRGLVIIEKVKPTPDGFPRNYGQIKKKPL